MAPSAELAEKVEALYREHLAWVFGDRPVFDRIALEPITNYAGEETFQVTIVYEGSEHTIDANKAVRMPSAMATPLEVLGLPPVFMQGYVPKDEYPMLLEMRAEALWGEDEE